jgi:hypothetical protein
MALPLNNRKQTVDLAAPVVRGSRIRRNPPPAPKKPPLIDREDREKLSATFGVIAIALAVAAVILGVGIYAGWSPREVELHFRMD